MRLTWDLVPVRHAGGWQRLLLLAATSFISWCCRYGHQSCIHLLSAHMHTLNLCISTFTYKYVGTCYSAPPPPPGLGERALQNLPTNTAVLPWQWASKGFPTTPVSKSLRIKANVIAVGREWAWCIFLCDGPGLQDSGIQQHMAYCKDRSHSSCHRFSHIGDHRCHKQHHVYTGLLEKSAKKSEGHWFYSLCTPFTI